MIFLMFMTLYAMFTQVFLEWAWYTEDSNMLLFVLGAIIFAIAIWIIITAIQALTGKFDDELKKNNDQ